MRMEYFFKIVFEVFLLLRMDFNLQMITMEKFLKDGNGQAKMLNGLRAMINRAKLVSKLI